MSGPKVVRIVTREEIEQRCRAQLARVDAALAEWSRIGKRNDCVSEAELAAANTRREALAALITTGRFADLQNQAPREEVFLRNDLRARLTIVAKAQAVARSKEKRDVEACATLLRTLLSRDIMLDADLRSGLEKGKPGALAKGFALLGAPPDLAAEVQRIAGLLREEEVPSTLQQWMDVNGEKPDPVVERLEERIAELSSLVGPERILVWRNRLAEAVSSPRERRGLVLDGIDVDTGRTLKAARARADALHELHLTLAEFAVFGLDPDPFMAGAADADADSLASRTSGARAMLDARRNANATAARRDAVLKALAEIGYEVAEGMSTAWVEEGRVVVRNANRPDYGVEVGGSAEGGRVQIRAVALTRDGHGPDIGRDRDAETIWCGDVSTLQDKLAKAGGSFVIERALPIGATPLKRVAIGSGGAVETDAEAPVLKTWSIR